MLKTNMEFCRGILFIRIRGDLNKKTIKGIICNDFKYIVLNIDNMYSIDGYAIKYLNDFYKKFKGGFLICDKFSVSKKLFKRIPKVSSEYDAFKEFERMI